MVPLRRSAVIEALEGLVDKDELTRALKGVDLIGKIAIIKIPKEWQHIKHEVGERILCRLGLDSVYMQVSPARNGDRVRGIEWLAGKKDTVTTYSEHGCRFKVDIEKVYFSPRLSYERMRIAKLVSRGEVIVNMFSGVGTFSIIIGKNVEGTKIFSIDNNPYAFGLMLENTVINRLNGRVIPILADARVAAEELESTADRVLMPLPELSLEYLPEAVSMLRGCGWVHVYLHENGETDEEAISRAKSAVISAMDGIGELKTVSGRVVRSVGRKNYQIVLDLVISR